MLAVTDLVGQPAVPGVFTTHFDSWNGLTRARRLPAKFVRVVANYENQFS